MVGFNIYGHLISALKGVHALLEPRPFVCDSYITDVDFVYPMDKKNKKGSLHDSTLPGARALSRWISKPDADGLHFWSIRHFDYVQHVSGENDHGEKLNDMLAKMHKMHNEMTQEGAALTKDTVKPVVEMNEEYSSQLSIMRRALRDKATADLEALAVQTCALLMQFSKSELKANASCDMCPIITTAVDKALAVTKAEGGEELRHTALDMKMSFQEANSKQALISAIHDVNVNKHVAPTLEAQASQSHVLWCHSHHSSAQTALGSQLSPRWFYTTIDCTLILVLCHWTLRFMICLTSHCEDGGHNHSQDCELQSKKHLIQDLVTPGSPSSNNGLPIITPTGSPSSHTHSDVVNMQT